MCVSGLEVVARLEPFLSLCEVWFHWGTVDSMLSSLWVTSSLGIRADAAAPGTPSVAPLSYFGLTLLGLHRCVLEGGAGPLGAYPQMTQRHRAAFHDSDIRDIVVPVEKAAFFLCYSPITQYDDSLPYQAS